MARIVNLHVPTSLLALAAFDFAILYVSIAAGLLASYSDVSSVLHDTDTVVKEVIFVGTNLTMIFAMGLYQRRFVASVWDTVIRLCLAQVVAFLFLTILFYFVPYARIWISALLPAMVIAIAGLALVRGLFLHLADLSTFKRRLLVLGAGRQAQRIEAAERSLLPGRFTCVGFVPLDDAPVAVTFSKVVQNRDLVSFCQRAKIDDIVLALDERRGVMPMELLLSLHFKGIRVVDISSFFEREMGRLEIDSMRPSWLILSDGGTRGRIESVLKRTFDVAASLVLLIVTLPITVPTMVAVYATDRGPVFYRQERVGFAGGRFSLLKFRSMKVDAERDGVARWATLQDPRATLVGSMIRKLRIDEIPQVYNVLRGEMSFVGPRPERPSIVKQLAEEIPFYQCRHSVKPGITGWAQINYPYGATIADAAEKLKYDLYYIKNRSVFFDLAILLQTLRVVLWPQGAR